MCDLCENPLKLASCFILYIIGQMLYMYIYIYIYISLQHVIYYILHNIV